MRPWAKYKNTSTSECDTPGCRTIAQRVYESDRPIPGTTDEEYIREMGELGWRVKRIGEYEWIKRCPNCGHLPLEP